MFNVLSPKLATVVAELAGLHKDTCDLLLIPPNKCKGLWRLPMKCEAEPFASQRGMARGLASSVLLAEVLAMPLLKQIDAVCHGQVTVAYVDDINILCTDRGTLIKVVDLVKANSERLELSLSTSKTKVWCSNYVQAQNLARQYDFSPAKSVTILGGDWEPLPNSKASFQKEHQRVDEALRRIDRLRSCPIRVIDKMAVLAMGCLSLLSYLNPIMPEAVRALKTPIKACLSASLASPEILFYGISDALLDPYAVWLIAGLALVWRVLLEGIPEAHLQLIRGHRDKSRLSYILIEAEKQDIHVHSRHFIVDDRTYPVTWEWSFARFAIIKSTRRRALEKVALRRPNHFEGIGELSRKLMRKFCRQLSNWHAMILVKLWSGCAMRGSKRAVITSENCACQCGELNPTLHHTLWACPSTPIPSPLVHTWQAMPLAYSVSPNW